MNYNRTKKLVIFPASLKGVGLLFHFTELGICFSKGLSTRDDYDFLLVSEKEEQNPGLWDKLQASIPQKEILQTDSYKDFPKIVEEKLKNNRYDRVVVLTQGLLQFSGLIPLKRKYGRRLFLYVRLNSFRHGTLYRWPLTYYYSKLFVKYADFVNFQCAYTADIFANSKAIFDNGIGGFIPLGLAEEQLLMPDYEDWVGALEDNSATKIVYLASFHKHKRHAQLIDAMADLLLQNKSLKLLLLGNGTLYNKIRQKVIRYGIESAVLMPGRIDRKYVPWVLDKADVSIVLSGVETFGHNILEPLYYGTPLLSTDVGIARDTVKDFDTGFLLHTLSFKQLRKHIEYLMNNKQALSNMELRAKQLARQQYSWDNIVARYIRLFDSMSVSE